MDIEDHVKNFRPNFRSLMVYANTNENANMVGGSGDGTSSIDNKKYHAWLKKRKIKSFYTEINSASLRMSVSALMQSIGVGKLKPNMLIIGFQNNGYTDKSVLEYYDIINDKFQL
jgi:hypothetical protein